MREELNYFLSYFTTIRKSFRSEFSGDLEVVYYKGHKELNSKNANYSYGALQETLQFAIEQTDLSQINNVLLLGLGGGSVIQALRKLNFNGPIDAIEIDSKIIDIAKNEFGLNSENNLAIYCDDAFHFVENCESSYDLIIIDLFIDTKVPVIFMKPIFWEYVISLLRQRSWIIFNTMHEQDNLQNIKNILDKHGFECNEYRDIMDTNTLIIASLPLE